MVEIKLKLKEEDVNNLLYKNGYVIDTVLMWYYKNPYDDEQTNESEMGSYYVKVVYPKGLHCDWKDEERPLMNKYKQFEYNTAVEGIISNLMLKKLL